MSNQRLAKFKKLENLQEQQLDMIRLELAGKQAELNRLETERQKLHDELTQIQKPARSVGNPATTRQLIHRQMEKTQHRINATNAEISTVAEQVQQVLQRYQQHNSKLKSWQKLVEKEAGRIHQNQIKREFDDADERFLSTSEHRRA